MKPRRGTSKPGGRSVRPAKADRGKWVLRLYVAGQTLKTVTVLRNLQRICDERLKGQYSLEVIDLAQNPQLARDHQILAIPTLVRKLPKPMRRIIGDLSDVERVLIGLDVIGVDG